LVASKAFSAADDQPIAFGSQIANVGKKNTSVNSKSYIGTNGATPR
jgi:hypothetical protein